MTEASLLAVNGFKYIGTPYKKMDCQAFIEQCLKDAGISINLPGSNAWYRKMSWRGSPEECKKTFGRIPSGAFIFIVKDYSASTPEKYLKDGLLDATHIGIVTVSGEGAIHSSSSRQCVCGSKFCGRTIPNGGWNMIGLWDKLSYGADIDTKLRGDTQMPGIKAETAVVTADAGEHVKMRARPSTSCATYWLVPIGAEVELLAEASTGSAGWSLIKWDGKTGYMMTRFLAAADRTGEENQNSQTDQLRSDLELLVSLAAQMREAADRILIHYMKEDDQGVG